MKQFKLLFFLLTFILVLGVNSCKKDELPSSVTDANTTQKSILQLAPIQKVSADEMLTWFAANLASTGLQPGWDQAVETVMNGKHVIEVPTSADAALFFTKENGVLSVYAYKWLVKEKTEKGISGNVIYYSFRTNMLNASIYDKGRLVKNMVSDLSKYTTTSSVSTSNIKTLSSTSNAAVPLGGGQKVHSNGFTIFDMIGCVLGGGTWIGFYTGCAWGESSWWGNLLGMLGDFFNFGEGGGGGDDETYTSYDGSSTTVSNGGLYYNGSDGSSASMTNVTSQGGGDGPIFYAMVNAPCSTSGPGGRDPIGLPPGDGGNPCGSASQWISAASLITDSSVQTDADDPANISDVDPDDIWWDDTTLSFPAQTLPSFATLWANFPFDANHNELPPETVYSSVGGTVKSIFLSSGNRNACALRLSIALNKSGVVIPNITGQTFQGADGKYYFLSSAKIYNFMVKTFGAPNVLLNESDGGTNGSLFQNKLIGQKGIFIMKAKNPKLFNAYGHATLYNGFGCAGGIDGCDFRAAGGVKRIALWKTN